MFVETHPMFTPGPMPPDPLTQQLLLVATAHIHWDPEFSDVKLVQTMMLMYELQNFVEETTHKYQLPYPGPHLCKSIPFVLCGDLNSLPESGKWDGSKLNGCGDIFLFAHRTAHCDHYLGSCFIGFYMYVDVCRQ